MKTYQIKRLQTGDIVAIPIPSTLLPRAKEQKCQRDPSVLELCSENRVIERKQYWERVLYDRQ